MIKVLMVQILVGEEIFSSPKHPYQFWCPHTIPIQWKMGALSLGDKVAKL